MVGVLFTMRESSILTPNFFGMYIPGSTVIAIFFASLVLLRRDIAGDS